MIKELVEWPYISFNLIVVFICLEFLIYFNAIYHFNGNSDTHKFTTSETSQSICLSKKLNKKIFLCEQRAEKEKDKDILLVVMSCMFDSCKISNLTISFPKL